ncbi:MAG: VanZ family protein [Chloroflexota bacterium]
MLKLTWLPQNPLVRQIIALAYTAVLTVALLQSSSHPYVGPPAPPGAPDPGRELFLTSGHIIGFTLLVLLWWWVLSPWPRPLLIAVLIALLLGTITEILQSLVPDRSSNLFDLATNYIVTLAVAWIIHTYRVRKANSPL